MYLMINLSCFASTFETTILVGARETKGFTVTGLYEPFRYSMSCTVKIPKFCLPPLNPHGEITSAYIITSTINGRTGSIQKDYRCNHNQCYPGYFGKCALNPDVQLYEIGFSDITNGSTFNFINRPEFPLEFHCVIK